MMYLLQCKEGSFTNEMFMTVIKSTDSIDELVSVVEQLDCDISKWRSKDTGGSDGRLSPFLPLFDDCFKCQLIINVFK